MYVAAEEHYTKSADFYYQLIISLHGEGIFTKSGQVASRHAPSAAWPASDWLSSPGRWLPWPQHFRLSHSSDCGLAGLADVIYVNCADTVRTHYIGVHLTFVIQHKK